MVNQDRNLFLELRVFKKILFTITKNINLTKQIPSLYFIFQRKREKEREREREREREQKKKR